MHSFRHTHNIENPEVTLYLHQRFKIYTSGHDDFKARLNHCIHIKCAVTVASIINTAGVRYNKSHSPAAI